MESSPTSSLSSWSLGSDGVGSELPLTSYAERKTPKARRGCYLTFPPCDICGGTASGLHYGCNTCEACKNFFRRFMIRKKPYECPKQKNCEISAENKSNCSACRLAKCLELGMCKEKCRLGRYNNRRRTEAIKVMKQLEVRADTGKPAVENTSAVTVYSGVPTAVCTSGPTIEAPYEDTVIDQLTTSMASVRPFMIDLDDEDVRNSIFKAHHEKYTRKKEMFGSMNAISMSEYKTLLKNFNIDLDGHYEVWKRLAEPVEIAFRRYSDFITSMPGFVSMSCIDQQNLLKASFILAFTFLTYKGCSLEYSILIEMNGEPFHIEEYSDKFITRAAVEEAFKVFRFLQKLELTKEEEALLTAIATFSADFCKVENADAVEAIQMQYVSLLHRHLNSKYDKSRASRRFSKLLDSLVRIRHLASINYHEMRSLASDELVMDVMPQLADMIPVEA